MKEGEAAAVGLQPAAQVIPAVDLMDGLVMDDPLEEGGRRMPVDTRQLQEARVEPG